MPTTLTDSDSFSFSDSLVMQLTYPLGKEVGDNLFLADSAEFHVSMLARLSDHFVLSDSLRLMRGIGLELSDSLNLSDAGAAPVMAVEIRLTLSDTFSFSDIVSTSPSTALDQYLRRYLNDVS